MNSTTVLANSPEVFLLTLRATKKYNLKSFYTGAKWYGFFSHLFNGHADKLVKDDSRFAFAPLERGGTNLVPGDMIDIRIILPAEYEDEFFNKLKAGLKHTKSDQRGNIQSYFEFESYRKITPSVKTMLEITSELTTTPGLQINLKTPLILGSPKHEILKRARADTDAKLPAFADSELFERYPYLCLRKFLFCCYLRGVSLGFIEDTFTEDSLPYPQECSLGSLQLNLISVLTIYGKKHFFGVIGSLKFDWTPAPFWAQLLTVAAIYHLRKHSNYGFGYFVFPEITSTLTRQTQSLYLRLMHPQRLRKRIRHDTKSRYMSKLFLALLENYLELSTNNMDLLRIRSKNKHLPQAIPDTDAKLLTLDPLAAVICAEAVEMLRGGLEDILGSKTKKKESFLTPEYELNTLRSQYKTGKRYAVSGMIENLFVEFPHILLKNKLEAIYGNDPLVELILRILTEIIPAENLCNAEERIALQDEPLTRLFIRLALDKIYRVCYRRGLALASFRNKITVICTDQPEAEATKQLLTTLLDAINLNFSGHISVLTKPPTFAILKL